MSELNISPNFTVEDIHRIREYNYEKTKNMTVEERLTYYRRSADSIQKQIEKARAIKKSGKTAK